MINLIDSDLLDIINGYSKVEDTPGIFFYYKHPTIFELLELDRFYQESFEEAKRKGVLTEDELIKQAIRYGGWTIQDEEFIKTTLWEIDKLSIAAEKIVDPTQKKITWKRVEDKKEAVLQKKQKREEIVKLSAENLADSKRFRKQIIQKCFKNKDFTVKHNIQSINQLSELIKRLNTHDYLLKLSYNYSFFEIYSLYKKSPDNIFNKKGFELTVYQKNLIVLASILLSKLEAYGHEMDKNKKDDPLYVYKYKSKGEVSQESGDEKDLLNKARAGKNITAEDLLG